MQIEQLIIKAACKVFNVTEDELKSKSREKPLTDIRHVVMDRIRRDTELSTK